MANTYKSKYTETSAALNHNVDELLVGILTQIRLKLQTHVKVSISKLGNIKYIRMCEINMSYQRISYTESLKEACVNSPS